MVTALVEDADAACSKPATYLLENQPAPCTGYLLNEASGKEIAAKLITEQLQAQEIEQYKLMLDNQAKQLASYNSSLESYSSEIKSLKAQRTFSEFEKVLYFIGGVALTVMVERSLAH